MSAASTRLSILLLTEDSAKQAHHVLEAITRKLFRQLDPACDLQPAKVRFEPATEDARQVARANNWKAPAHRHLVAFRQYIATQLVLEHGFVVFHVDGDRVYAQRHTGENVRKFDELIRRPVRVILEGPPPRRRERRSPLPPAADVEERLAKLFLLAPFYSIESWLYQNIRLAARLCQSNPACLGQCLERLSAWAAERGALDEVNQPKKQLCFKDRHNAELAGAGYPTAEVLAAGKSLHDAFTPMRDCPALVRALATTHA